MVSTQQDLHDILTTGKVLSNSTAVTVQGPKWQMIYPLQSAIRESISSHRHQDDTLFLLLSTKLA